jgi:hypothetical protein
MGAFSASNNMTDISLLPEFAGIVGLTQEELENYFKPFIGRTADTLKMKENVLLEKSRTIIAVFLLTGRPGCTIPSPP